MGKSYQSHHHVTRAWEYAAANMSCVPVTQRVSCHPDVAASQVCVGARLGPLRILAVELPVCRAATQQSVGQHASFQSLFFSRTCAATVQHVSSASSTLIHFNFCLGRPQHGYSQNNPRISWHGATTFKTIMARTMWQGSRKDSPGGFCGGSTATVVVTSVPVSGQFTI